MGCLAAVVCIRVKDWRILLDRRRCAGSRHVSTSNAEVAVVRNVPRIAFIAVLCARLGSPYRTSSNRTEPYRAFSSRIATPLGIFEREPNRIEVPMLALDNVRFE